MSASAAVRLFYLLKPLIPRKLQVALRRKRAAGILKDIGAARVRPLDTEVPLSFPWPEGCLAGGLVTHDVETLDGQRNIPSLLEVERKLGVRSCWNFVADRYTVDEGLIGELRSEGCEIGVHGVRHDGRLFSSATVFSGRMVRVREIAARWGASGFRSPSLLHDEGLLSSELTLSWDSSVPAWDPFQPQRGGSGRYTPYMLNEMCVELPVTLWQDFTLFEELGMTDIGLWREQSLAIAGMGGLVNVIVHPDYTMTGNRLGLYEELLEHLRAMDGLRLMLPSEAAEICRNAQSRSPQ